MTSRAFHDHLGKRARKAGLAIDPPLAGQLEQYFSLLARWNAKINLTAFNLQDPNDQAFDRLLIEPILAASHAPAGAFSAIDVGSGSGSPAIPFALASKAARLTMVESKTRKAVFLLEAVRAIGVISATVEASRFEQLLPRPDLHEAFDVMTVRAVRVELATLLTLQALVKPTGRLFLFQGHGRALPAGDLSAFPLVHTRTVPLVESLRSELVILTKQRPPT